MSAHKIPPALNDELLRLAAEGKSLQAICAWLQATHGIEVGDTAVSKRLRKLRGERSEIAKTVVREKLAKTLTSDIDVLDREKRRLMRLATKLFKRAYDGANVSDILSKRSPTELYVHVVAEMRKIVDTKLHYSGADTPDDSLTELAAAEERLASRMAGAAERLRAAGVSGDVRPPGKGGT